MNVQIATVVAAAITGAATVFATFMTIRSARDSDYAPVGRAERESLSGRWRGTWIITNPPKRREGPFEDVVELRVDSKGRIRGRGVDSNHGDAIYEGRGARYALTLSYRGAGQDDERIGTVLLERDIRNQKMTGQWAQVSDGKVMISGTVEWKKM